MALADAMEGSTLIVIGYQHEISLWTVESFDIPDLWSHTSPLTRDL